MCRNCETLTFALRGILWKLERKELNANGKCQWAQIDRRDATVRDGRKALKDTWEGQPYQTAIKP